MKLNDQAESLYQCIRNRLEGMQLEACRGELRLTPLELLYAVSDEVKLLRAAFLAGLVSEEMGLLLKGYEEKAPAQAIVIEAA